MTDESNNATPLPPEVPVGAAAEGALTDGQQPPAEALTPRADESAHPALPEGGKGMGEEGREPAAPPAQPQPVAKTRPARAKKVAVAEAKAEEAPPAEPKSEKMDWFILKVQSNREDSIRDGLQRRVKIAGLDKYFGDVIVPIEMVTEFKGG